MSNGLRVRDASGNISLDITDRLTTYFGTYNISISGYNTSASISVPGIDSINYAGYGASCAVQLTSNTITIYRLAGVGTLAYSVFIFKI